MTDVEQYRRKITKTHTGKYVHNYLYDLECGHVQEGDAGMTHKQAQRRKTLICQQCRQEGDRAARA